MKEDEWKNRCWGRWACDLLPLLRFSQSCFRIITRSNRAPSVIEKSGASSHQGLTPRGDELDLLEMTFPSPSNLPTPVDVYTNTHIAAS